MDPSKVFALVLAGGNGHDFWPLTRKGRSKPLLRLFTGKTLLEDTLERLEGVVPENNILILTNSEQEESIAGLLPKLPRSNIIAEPQNRDTAAAVALGAAWVALRDHSATMIVLPADHLIDDRLSFGKALHSAIDAARSHGALIAMGIHPTWASPNFGYIEIRRKALATDGPHEPHTCHEVVRFREKPNSELAKAFVESDNFRWNTGIYIWQIPAILSAFDRHAPEMAAFIERIHETRDIPEAMASQFPNLPRISIEYAVMEKASRVLAIEAGFSWDDIGTWASVLQHLAPQENESASNCGLTQVNASHNFALTHNGKHVAFVGVTDLILVETEDAVMVCRRDHAEQIKDLALRVPRELQ